VLTTGSLGWPLASQRAIEAGRKAQTAALKAPQSNDK